MEKIKDIICINGFNSDSNSYIFDDIIVDTGTGMNKDYLLNALKKFNLDVDDINLIINTHGHFDHFGGNYIFPNAKVAIHEADADIIKNSDDYLSASFLFNQTNKRNDVDILLKGNEKFGDFQVISTPGHSSGGICLYDGEFLISGDTIFADGGVGRTDIGGNVDDLKNSLLKIKDLTPEYILPGHGMWCDNGVSNIKMSLNLLGL